MVRKEENIGLVTVHVTEGMLRAMVVRGALESAGIPVMLSYESVTPMQVKVESSGQVRVMVPTEWADEAEMLLASTPRTGEIFSVPADVHKKG